MVTRAACHPLSSQPPSSSSTYPQELAESPHPDPDSTHIEFEMTTVNKPAPSVIRPGKAPEGPSGWEERRVEKQIEQQQAQERRNHRRENSAGMAGIKEKVHKIGEKLHLVEPKDPSQRTAAQLQVSVTHARLLIQVRETDVLTT